MGSTVPCSVPELLRSCSLVHAAAGISDAAPATVRRACCEADLKCNTLKAPCMLAATLSRRSCSMQSSGRQQRVKASTSNISLGDNRIPTFATSYGRDFHAPFETSIRRRATCAARLLAFTCRCSICRS